MWNLFHLTSIKINLDFSSHYDFNHQIMTRSYQIKSQNSSVSVTHNFFPHDFNFLSLFTTYNGNIFFIKLSFNFIHLLFQWQKWASTVFSIFTCFNSLEWKCWTRHSFRTKDDFNINFNLKALCPQTCLSCPWTPHRDNRELLVSRLHQAEFNKSLHATVI